MRRLMASRVINRKKQQAVCGECEQPFMAACSEVKRGGGKFCSRHCQRANQARVNALANFKGLTRTERKTLWSQRVGPEVPRAHHLVDKAIRQGELTRLPCEVCGAEKVDAHHDDYSKPLDVRWLCRFHHLQYHRGF